MFRLTVFGKDINEAKTKLFALAKEMGYTTDVQTELPLTDKVTVQYDSTGVTEPAKKSRTKKTTKTKTKTEATEDTAPATKNAPGVTRKDVMAALKTVHETSGIAGAKELLTRYKATRVSELNPKEYTAFINDCHAASAS